MNVVKKLSEIIETMVISMGGEAVAARLSVSDAAKHGDYATSAAFRLAKLLKKTPEEVAASLVWALTTEIDKDDSLRGAIDRVEPENGYVNITLSQEFLSNAIEEVVARDTSYGTSSQGKGQRVVVEYSSPNVAKPMHVGHFRATVIGESIRRLLKANGFDAVSVNHLGDWGTQFGKLLVGWQRWGDEPALTREPITELLRVYVKFHEEVTENPLLDDEARETFAKLEKGDGPLRAEWQRFVDVSLTEFKRIYARLGVAFDAITGESFYNAMLKEVVEELLDKKIAVRNPDGSVAVLFEKFDINLPSALILKRDGATLYLTRDLAAIKYRLKTYTPQALVYVVGSEQKLHFEQAFAIARLAGWDGHFVHIPFGIWRFPEGRMSTRHGKLVTAQELIDEAVSQVRALLKERRIEAEDIEHAIETIALGSLTYNELALSPNVVSTFTWDRVLSFEGRSAPYLLYTYARIRSIQRKADDRSEVGGWRSEPLLSSPSPEPRAPSVMPEERAVAVKLIHYPEVVERAGEEYASYILASYLYGLAERFNLFYQKIPVLNAEDDTTRQARLMLVKASGIVLKNGLSLLNINTLERM